MFLDVAFGVFASYLAGAIFHELVTWHLLCIGIVFVLLPDIDIFWNTYTKKIDHRSFLHYPFLYVVLSILIAISVGYKIAFLFFITTLFHCIHDTCILGWGVAWFAPFSYRRYKIFPDDGKGGFLHNRFLTWLPSEQEALEKTLNDPYWIRHWYGRVTVVSVIEFLAFLIAVTYMMYTF